MIPASGAWHAADSDPMAPYRSIPVGFRHFMRTPALSERFRIYGVDPLGSKASRTRLRQLMSRLAARMAMQVPWPRWDDSRVRNWENPHIPSGYTYLLQLVAHDLVQTSIPASLVQGPLNSASSGRVQGLSLETVYGGGPLACPFAYEPDDTDHEIRLKLRLGKIQPDKEQRNRPCPFRDIARATATGDGDRLTEVMIADSRNDDHPIIAQLTALFHQLHNAIVDLLKHARPIDCPSDRQAAFSRFLCARNAVALIYRQVIRRDLLKRILHPAVFDAYDSFSMRFLDPCDLADPDKPSGVNPTSDGLKSGDGIPLEFAHAAFRFGHAMVREEYRFNDLAEFELVTTLDRNSTREPRNMPLDKNWIVQWSHFFEINGSRPNLSRRIGPELSAGLLYEGRFRAIDDTGRVGLLYRDLMSGACAELWSVNALIRNVRSLRPELIERSPLLSDDDYRTAALREWLHHGRELSGLTHDDIRSLAAEPPLLLFILYEAAFEPQVNGTRLGILGSILVAEVIFGILARNPLPGEAGSSTREMLAQLCTTIYGENPLMHLPEIRSMAELVGATAELAQLHAAEPAFV